MKKVIAALILLMTVAHAAAQSKDEQQVLAAEQAMGKAIEAGDAVSYDKLTANDFQIIEASGAVRSKAERLAQMKSPSPGFRTSNHVIRIHGDVAIVTGRQGPGEGPVRFTRIWVRQGNEWRAVVTQATLIQQPKP